MVVRPAPKSTPLRPVPPAKIFMVISDEKFRRERKVVFLTIEDICCAASGFVILNVAAPPVLKILRVRLLPVPSIKMLLGKV